MARRVGTQRREPCEWFADAPRRRARVAGLPRLWRGARVLDVPQPVAVPRRDGPRARRPHRRELVARSTALSYLDFVAPGLLIASVVQMTAAESMWPVVAGDEVDALLPRHRRDPDHGARRLRRVRDLDRDPHACSARPSFLVVAALLGAIPSAWGVLAIPVAVLTAAAFCAPACRVLGRRRRPTSRSR